MAKVIRRHRAEKMVFEFNVVIYKDTTGEILESESFIISAPDSDSAHKCLSTSVEHYIDEYYGDDWDIVWDEKLINVTG